MPQKDNEGLSGPTVRRAVTMPGATADPESALRPQAGRKEAKEPEAAPEPTHGPTAEVTPGIGATSDDSSDTSADTSSTDTSSTDTSSADTSADEKSSADTASSSSARKGEESDTAVGGLVATEGGSPPGASKGDGASDDGDEPPSGRPTKALLAAAGIGGALLIAIPFLVAGTNNGDDSEPAAMARQTSAHPMPTNHEDGAPGVYAPKSPSADKPSSKAKVKPKAPESPAKPSPSLASPTKEVKEGSRTVPKEGIKASPKRAVAPIDYSNKKNVLLKNAVTGKCADIPNYGKGKVDGPIQQFDCNGTDADNQIWNFEVRYKGQGPHSTNLFQIRNGKDGLCMDLPYYGSADHGQAVTEFHCDGTTKDNQLWWLEKRGDKTFWIRNYASNQQCLAVKSARGSGDPSAPLAIGPCRSNANHEWVL